LSYPRGLAREEATQVRYFMTANFRWQATQYMAVRDRHQAQENDAVLRQIYGQGPGALFWKHHSARLAVADAASSFRAHVNEVLAK
jgi:hypothetical protein